jgi:hypothetical protein
MHQSVGPADPVGMSALLARATQFPYAGRPAETILDLPSGTDLSNGVWALPAIRLGFMYFGLRLPHTTNGRFKATILRAPVAVFFKGCPIPALRD